jgi:protein-disulfide isomerase
MSPRRRPLIALLPLTLLACAGPSSAPDIFVKVPVAGSPQRGPGDAWVTVVEFGDFQCPGCRSAEPMVQRLEAASGADLRVVWKNFPLSFHPFGQRAAVASVCADAQGKFWEMHDRLLTVYLSDESIAADAQSVTGLDVAAWTACYAEAITGQGAAASAVANDLALARDLAVPGTPTYVVNGHLLFGASEDMLRAAIDQARAVAIASGIPRAEYYDRAVLGR